LEIKYTKVDYVIRKAFIASFNLYPVIGQCVVKQCNTPFPDIAITKQSWAMTPLLMQYT